METHHQVIDQPLEVSATDGEIEITAPDGSSTSLTVDAAIESAKRMLQVARAAGMISGRDEIYQKPLG